MPVFHARRSTESVRSTPLRSDAPRGIDLARDGDSGDDDRALVDAAVTGDRDAFEVLVRRHGPSLHRYARRMLHDEGDVAEVVQDTFLASWRRLGSFRGDSAYRTWLFSICSRKIVDIRRVRRPHPCAEVIFDSAIGRSGLEPHHTAVANALVTDLEGALAELPPRQRASWFLREIEGHTFVEIGLKLGISADGARGHHHRARDALSARLKRWH